MDGETLRRRRRKLGYTQTELGEVLGVPQNTISRWEVGKARILHPVILDLALTELEDRKRRGALSAQAGSVAESKSRGVN